MSQPPEPDPRPPLPSTVLHPSAHGPPSHPTPPLDGPTSGPHAAPAPAGPAAPPARAGRYRIEAEIARGGMGAVFRAHDPDCDRPLAVKALLDRHRSDPDLERRFLAEARLTARLQHPGIAPVHEVGRLDDGRPFFAMKLVVGRTLGDLLRGRRDLKEDLPRFLKVFEQICQAVAYAHSQGVLHRDLKPSNVMVGAFGEAQVMDWGLAKQLWIADRGSPIQEEDPEAATARPPGNIQFEIRNLQFTEVGTVVGTAAYMAPEQARGEVNRLDERADVFGLGGILCVILTGKPPYEGPSRDELRHRVAAGDLAEAHARLDGCGAAAELLRLAKACLAADPEARPRDAGAVAAAAAAYLDSLAQRAHAAEVKAAEERKRRRLTAALAAAVLGLVAVGGGAAFWFERQESERQAELARRDEQTRQAVAGGVRQARALLQQARWEEARAVLAQAEARLNDGGAADFRPELAQAARELEFGPRLERIELEAASVLDGKLDWRVVEDGYTVALREFGLKLDAGAADAIRRLAIRDVILRVLDQWAGITDDDELRGRLLHLAHEVRPDPWRARLRDRAVWGNRTALQKLAAELAAADLPAQTAGMVAMLVGRLDGDALPLLRAAQQAHPDDFWTNFRLGGALVKTGRPDPVEAAAYFRAALAVRPSSDLAQYNLAVALERAGRAPEAEAAYRRATALNPRYAKAHNNLGRLLQARGELDGAAAAYRKAVELNPRDARANNNLGAVLHHRGRAAEALPSLEEAARLEPELMEAQLNLGGVLRELGRTDEAFEAYRRAVALAPESADVRHNFGTALLEEGRLDEAIAAFEEALRLDPKYAKAASNLGAALVQRGRRVDAIRVLRRAVSIDPNHAGAWYNLGVAIDPDAHNAEAFAAFEKAAGLDPTHAESLTNYGLGLLSRRRLPEALAAVERAVKLAPKLAPAHGALGKTLVELGRFGEAKLALERILALLPPTAPQRERVRKGVAECERLLGLQARLRAVLRGEAEPRDGREALAFAELCARFERRYAAAVRFYRAAFAALPQIATNARNGERYNAACAAVLAAGGKGVDTTALDALGAARLRQQALDWLRADLERWGELTAFSKEALVMVDHWRRDPDLAPVRDEAALAWLAEDERGAWRGFWADVDAFAKRL